MTTGSCCNSFSFPFPLLWRSASCLLGVLGPGESEEKTPSSIWNRRPFADGRLCSGLLAEARFPRWGKAGGGPWQRREDEGTTAAPGWDLRTEPQTFSTGPSISISTSVSTLAGGGLEGMDRASA